MLEVSPISITTERTLPLQVSRGRIVSMDTQQDIFIREQIPTPRGLTEIPPITKPTPRQLIENRFPQQEQFPDFHIPSSQQIEEISNPFSSM